VVLQNVLVDYRVSDTRLAVQMPEAGAFYGMHRSYIDFERLFRIWLRQNYRGRQFVLGKG